MEDGERGTPDGIAGPPKKGQSAALGIDVSGSGIGQDLGEVGAAQPRPQGPIGDDLDILQGRRLRVASGKIRPQSLTPR
ncbi:hypothetical protein MYX78_10405 [Acidobacteria bacterium AH-259-G07]|nr:hypothetical protein [Acidobacteria bacterium AH-259-G07]